jgi:putative oxidoreductase
MFSKVYTLGRILVPIFFIVSGVRQLLDIDAMTKMLAERQLPIPEQIPPMIMGLPRMQVLAYAIGGIEVICGLMVMAGVKARWAAAVLIIYAACPIAFVHRFWDMEGAAAAASEALALQYLAIAGALLLIIGAAPDRTTA